MTWESGASSAIPLAPPRTYYLGTGALKGPLRAYYLGTWGARVPVQEELENRLKEYLDDQLTW